jgi:predicted AAA+ superfamily ATPase
VGARRVGKSSLLEQLIQEFVREKRYSENEIFYMNKEFPEYD